MSAVPAPDSGSCSFKMVLTEASRVLGPEKVEFAYLIFIPFGAGKIIWRKISGKQDGFPGMEKIVFTDRAFISFSEKEFMEIKYLIGRSSRVIHIHNHPAPDNSPNYGIPSPADRETASFFRGLVPECRDKFLFYIIVRDKQYAYS
jgi:hypothetical protein